MNRREALRTLAAGSAAGALVGGMAIVTIPSAVAADADPILELIRVHDASWEALGDADETNTPEWNAANEADWEAWRLVCRTAPSTTAGLVALVLHVQRHATRACLEMSDGPAEALQNIAAGIGDLIQSDGRA